MKAETEIKVGCCGFATSQKECFRLFKLIEVQQTFYQLPRPGTAEKWHRTAPPDFEFTIKAWQLITYQPTSPTYHRLGKKIGPAQTFREKSLMLDAWRKMARELAEPDLDASRSEDQAEELIKGLTEAFERQMNDDLNVKGAIDAICNKLAGLVALKENKKLGRGDCVRIREALGGIDKVFQVIYS